MSEALKRIEEKHPSAEYSDAAPSSFCTTCIIATPCDVMKLARALDAIVNLPVRGDESQELLEAASEGGRMLEEVAGEK